ncbi:MAG: peptidoglycan DD-metalloendopeptidase family protein [Oceanospirillaceae bacterium]|nr:peptidoglycan DD-metalloendopeptidase family protein [Oceanospirillaceae bacterium]
MLSRIKKHAGEISKLYLWLPELHRKIVLGLTLFCLLLLVLPTASSSNFQVLNMPKLDDPQYQSIAETVHETINLPDYEWIVANGDTLGELFSLFNLSSTMSKILEADKNVLTLDVINKGDKYLFWLSEIDDFSSEQVVLIKMEQVLGIEHQVAFVRKGEGFEYKETLLEGEWRQQRIIGEIKKNSSFYKSAVALGLPATDVAVIGRLLKSKINFSRSTAAGDKFQIVLSSQFIGEQPTGNTKIEGVRFFNRSNVYSAFSYKGNFFDSKGEGLERAFTRYPVKGKFRISSSFNPRRRHPITKLIRPHNGTDFAVPTGTPIYAPGDGRVKRVVRHKYAGLYIEIEHSYKYRSRFLHLSKSLVRKGQRIKRGQKIALSGNSGASTGAHLHYEFHVNKKAINAMGSKVPIAIGVDRKSMLAYKRRVSDLIELMESKDISSIKNTASHSG